MQKLLKALFSLSLLLSLNSCIGFSTREIFTDLKDNKNIICQNPPANVDLYFDSETIPFGYEKIGLIEVQGEITSNDKEILEKLKVLAKSKCCDAIIGLKKNYINRESGILFSDQPTEEYKTISYNGIAVKKI